MQSISIEYLYWHTYCKTQSWSLLIIFNLKEESVTDWEKSNKRLQAILRKEISVRQEILSNLSQQEYMLLIGAIQRKRELEEKNSTLIQHLKIVAKEKGHLMRHLCTIMSTNISKNILNEFLDITQETEGETALLYQKASTLGKKIQDMHLRVKVFFNMVQQKGAPNTNTYAHIIPTKCYKKRNKRLTLTALDDSKESID